MENPDIQWVLKGHITSSEDDGSDKGFNLEE